ncbi:GPW/gp25 family protein [Desulfocurvus sp. DL9XJH121]
MLGMDSQSGAPLSGLAHVRQSVSDILSTPVGSRVMRRDYGSRLPDLLDAPVSPELVVEVYAETAAALARWEPRFKLSSVRLAEAEAGHMVLDLTGEYLVDGKTVALEGVVV